ncbi:MAG: metallophosphoesterase [Opitutaceae bacterium]|nr:metallophosphoesterase [Opitutaceae bacterium]
MALIPDTQYYTMKKFGGTPEMFFAQTRWIAQNAKRLNIAFALHLGDITDTGDVFENAEWDIADAAMKILEDPKVSGLPHGVPYDICVGNHDQRFLAPDGKHKYNGPALYFDKYFGIKRFQGRPYYGGHYGDNNKNHYTLFDAGSAKFIVVSLDYRAPAKNPAVLEWAAGLLDQHADRQAIILTHDSLLPGVPGSFGTDGAAVFNALKTKPNLLLIVGGHTTGEGWRTDTREDLPPVHSLVQDFQLDENGGDGWLRLLTFSPAENKILATTYSPFLDRWRDDPAGKFSIPHDFGTKIAPFEKIASVKTSPGKTVSVPWKTPAPAREWFAEISDGRKTIRTAPQLIPAP